MGKYANFYDGVRKLLDKIADALDPGTADTKTANYQTAVLNSLSRIGDKVGDVVSATLPDASTATDGDTLVVADGEWTIGSGGGTGGGVLVCTLNMETMALDKTWNEIASSSSAVLNVTVENTKYFAPLYMTQIISENEFQAYFFRIENGSRIESDLFIASSADGYPVAQE